MVMPTQTIPIMSPSRETSQAQCEGKVTSAATPMPFSFQLDPIVGKLRETAKIMIVDDEPLNVKVFLKHLKLAGFQHFVTQTDPVPVVELIEREMPDVILLDVMMPIVSGLEILRRLAEKEQFVSIPKIVLTASDNEQIKIEALTLGAIDFLNKPINAAELVIRVRNALLIKAHYDNLRDYTNKLEHQVRLRTEELAASRLELIHCLARAAEYRDTQTGRHVIRVGHYAEIIAHRMGLDEQTVELIMHAAPLHDMGKVGIPDEILLKTEKLEPSEFEIMQKHCDYGHHTFEPMDQNEWRTLKSHTFLGQEIMDVDRSPIIRMASTIALTHHEKWDGTGYPHGLAGEDIPLPGRITAVADVFDALSSNRPYKQAFPLEKCLQIIREGSDTHFDPQVVEAFVAGWDEVVAVHMDNLDTE